MAGPRPVREVDAPLDSIESTGIVPVSDKTPACVRKRVAETR
jgi:hypothetical protein